MFPRETIEKNEPECPTCARYLSIIEMEYERCFTCGGLPDCECKGAGCQKCAGLGVIKLEKQKDI